MEEKTQNDGLRHLYYFLLTMHYGSDTRQTAKTKENQNILDSIHHEICIQNHDIHSDNLDVPNS